MILDDRMRAIGKIISIAADKFVIEMHGATDNFTVVGFDDMHYVARLGSFLLIPVQSDYVVAEIVGLRDRDPQATRALDGAVLDKLHSVKYLDVVPLGMLPQQQGDFRFGVSTFPPLYADALYALSGDLNRIFQTDQYKESVHNEKGDEIGTRYKSLAIGTSSVFQDYSVRIKLDEFFGGHSAILGNTGSGKSCTVASILQAIFEKPDECASRGATFIIFDVNGEYIQALNKFKNDEISVETLTLDGSSGKDKFCIPHWFLDHSEWELLLQASEKTQVPILRTALSISSLFASSDNERKNVTKNHIIAKCILECFSGTTDSAPVSKRQRIAALLEKYGINGLDKSLLNKYDYDAGFANFGKHGDIIQEKQRKQDCFLNEVRNHIDNNFEFKNYNKEPFLFDKFEEYLDLSLIYAESNGNKQIRDYCSQMLMRFSSLLHNKEYDFLKCSPNLEVTENDFMKKVLGISGERKSHQIILIQMNDVPDEIVELVAAVLSRMIFDKLKQAEPRNRFPVHMVLEEAHRYISEKPSKYAIDASLIFERIAKEGRKYGMFLMIASQRPSELSKTVLSQCSNFIVHRIQNPDDLIQIRQMTPAISDSVLRRLPSLPKQHALLFGNATNLPTTFRVREANPRPTSDDTKISECWFHGIDTKIQGLNFSSQEALFAHEPASSADFVEPELAEENA